MSSAESVAALPGGAEFAALWRQVDGDAGTVGDLAAHLNRAAAETGAVGRSVTGTVHSVGDGWNGPAADAFGHYLTTVGAAARQVDTALGRAAHAVTGAAHELTSARSKVEAIASRVLDEVRRLDPDDLVTRGLVLDAVSRGCAEARPAVTALSQHLQQAAQALHGMLDDEAFASLAAPGTGAYLPAKGRPIQWQAAPRDGHGTDPAASSGTGSGSGSGGSGGSGGDSGAATATSGSGGSGGSGGPPAAQPTGDVKTWIEQATKILTDHGVSADKIDPAAINTIIEHESSGNPHAINLTDSNAAAGHPSKGLMQTIDSTFDAYALPGHHDVWNPVDNIVAGVRYALSRYGSLANVPGVAAVHGGDGYVGY